MDTVEPAELSVYDKWRLQRGIRPQNNSCEPEPETLRDTPSRRPYNLELSQAQYSLPYTIAPRKKPISSPHLILKSILKLKGKANTVTPAVRLFMWKCPLCGELLEGKNKLESHLDNVHHVEGIELAYCHKRGCDIVFLDDASLGDHLSKTHSVNTQSVPLLPIPLKQGESEGNFVKTAEISEDNELISTDNLSMEGEESYTNTDLTNYKTNDSNNEDVAVLNNNYNSIEGSEIPGSSIPTTTTDTLDESVSFVPQSPEKEAVSACMFCTFSTTDGEAILKEHMQVFHKMEK